MSSVPSSAQASCLGKLFGSAKGRRDIAYVAALVWAIMLPPLEFVIEVGVEILERCHPLMMGCCLGGSECGSLYWIGFLVVRRRPCRWVYL